MDCPRCRTAMELREVGGLPIDHCPKCQGSFYDHAELGRMFAVPDREMKSSHLLGRTPALDLEQPVACPRCGGGMDRERYLSDCPVVIDRCPQHGLWLDGGELDALLEHMTAKAQPGGVWEALKRLLTGG